MVHFNGRYQIKIELDIDDTGDDMLPRFELIHKWDNLSQWIIDLLSDVLLDDPYVGGSITVTPISNNTNNQ